MDEIRSGSFAQQVKDATAKVTEIVFTSPTEAAVRYDINIENYTNFPGRIGQGAADRRSLEGRTRRPSAPTSRSPARPCPTE